MPKKHNDPLALCAKLSTAIRDVVQDSYWRGFGAGKTAQLHWNKLAKDEAATLRFLKDLHKRIAKLAARLDQLEARATHRPVQNDNRIPILCRDAPGAPHAAE